MPKTTTILFVAMNPYLLLSLTYRQHIYCAWPGTVIGHNGMKQYVIDEIRAPDYEKISAYLNEEFGSPEMGGIYWIPLPEMLMNDVQQAHKTCQPYYFALDLVHECLSCELLVRTKSRVRCDCMGYANESQRNWIVSVVDAMFEKLEIYT